MAEYCDTHNQKRSASGQCPKCEIDRQGDDAIIDVKGFSDAEREELDSTRFGTIMDPCSFTDEDWKKLMSPSFGKMYVVKSTVNYIAAYQAQCIDGNQIQANLSLTDVPEGTTPGSIIELVTEQACADIARSGRNATNVLVLNLSRVW